MNFKDMEHEFYIKKDRRSMYDKPADRTVGGLIRTSLDHAKCANAIERTSEFKNKDNGATKLYKNQRIGILEANISLLRYLTTEKRTNIQRATWTIKNLENQVISLQ